MTMIDTRTKTQKWYDRLLAKIARDRQSDAEVAKAAGLTLAEYDADVTADDPRDEEAE